MKSIQFPPIEHIEALYSQTHCITIVARKLHVREMSLRKYLQSNNIDTKLWRKKYPKKHIGFPSIESIKQSYIKTHGILYTARNLGMSYHSLLDYLKINGVDLRVWEKEYRGHRYINGYDNMPSIEKIKSLYMSKRECPYLKFVAQDLGIVWNRLKHYLKDNNVHIKDWALEKIHQEYELGIRKNPMQGLTNENSPMVKAKSEKISKILKKKWDKGELVSPIMGQTKENNAILKKISQALMGHPYNGTADTLKKLGEMGRKRNQSIKGTHIAPIEDRICPCGIVFSVLKTSKRKYHSQECYNKSPKKDHRPRQGKGYSNCRGGYRKDLKHYVRSGWEANICRLLKFFGKEYKYEPETFCFNNVYYTPDLLVGDTYYEIKGHAKSRDIWDCNCIFCKKTKPKFDIAKNKLKIKMIGNKEYKLLTKRYSKKISLWEY